MDIFKPILDALPQIPMAKKLFAKGGKIFKAGDMWSESFDYDGMMKFGQTITENTSPSVLRKYFESLQDVNYHTLAAPLWDLLESTDSNAKYQISKFKKELKKSGYAKGGKIKDYSGRYSSIHDFIGKHNLKQEADKLFGKDWEADDDMADIRELIGENWEVGEIDKDTQRDTRSDDYIQVNRYAEGGEIKYIIEGKNKDGEVVSDLFSTTKKKAEEFAEEIKKSNKSVVKVDISEYKGGKVKKMASGASVRYSSKRKGPSNSATWYSPGETQIGNDGNYWRISQNVNGVNRWVKMAKGGGVNGEIKGYVWVETDDPKDNPETYSTHKEVMEAIEDFNNGFETNYKSISEFNAGEDYREIMTPLEYTKFLQGYADRQDESLGMRRGKQSSKKVSAKGRRDDSYGKWGKRDSEHRGTSMAKGGDIPSASTIQGDGDFIEDYPVDEGYNSNAGNAEVYEYKGKKYQVTTWNDRAEEHEPDSTTVSLIEYAKGGKINKEWLSHQSQAYTDRILKSIADYYGTSVSSIRKEIYDKDAEMIYEYIGNDRGLQRKVHEEMEAWMFSYNKYAKGGKTQGYNARLDESLGSRTGKGKSQSYKSRRDESKGTEKSMGKRPYSSVGTMDFEL